MCEGQEVPLLRTDPSPGTAHVRLLPTLISIGMLVSLVAALGAPLLPIVAEDYGRSLGDAQWALTATLLVGAAATPVMGRLGDGRHRRPTVLLALASIAAGALLSAIPAGFGLLIAGRALQGVGLGLLPMCMTIARDHLPKEVAGSAVSLLSVTTAIGAGVGFPIGALAVDLIGLHGAFLLVAAASTATGAAAWVTLPSSDHLPIRRIDIGSVALLAAGLGLALLGLGRAPLMGVTSPTTVISVAAGVACLALWTRRSLSSPHPLVDFRLLANPSLLTAHLTAFLAGVGMYVLSSLIVGFVQVPTETGYGLGRSVTTAGMLLIPFSICTYLGNVIRNRTRRTVPANRRMTIACLIYLGGAIAFLTGRSSLGVIVAVSAASGLGLGILLASIPELIIRNVRHGEIGSSLGLNHVLRTVGGSIGSAAGGAILAAHTAAGDTYPSDAGYSASTALVAGVWLVMIAMIVWRGSSIGPSREVAAPKRDTSGPVADAGGRPIYG